MKENSDEFQYVVVEFLQLPYEDIGDYVCIPRSWIRARRVTDRRSVVSYPDEPPSITKMRIMNCDKPSEKWKLYMAIVKVETNSYKDAYEYIMEKIHYASRSRNSAVIKTDYKRVPATATKRYSPSLKTINLSNPQSKKNINKLKVVDKVRQSDMISNPSKYPEHSDVESRTLTSSKLESSVSSENTVIKQNSKKGHQDQASRDVRSSSDDLLLRYPYIQRKPENDRGTQVNSPEAGSRSTGKTLYALKSPLTFVNQTCITYEPTVCSKMTSDSHASIACTNSAEHHDSIEEDMIVDELTVASYIKQNVFSGTRAENESSADPKALEETNHSGQTIESSMEEGSPIVEAVTSTEISSTQDVDDDERCNSSELNSVEIITTSPNSNEQAKRSVISLLNKADIWADQLNELFQKMRVDFSETCQFAHDMHVSLVQSQRIIECIANASENLRALKNGKVAVVTSKEVTPEVQQIAEVNQAERKEEENLDVSMAEGRKENNDMNSKSSENDHDCGGGGDIQDVNDQDRDNVVPKTTRGHIRTFVLPPEYDPHDTRWTLKYRENDPKLKLVELIPGSSVFINSLKLAHCIRSARDSKALARKLLEEIFTQSALSVCSLTGVRANAFDISGTNVRPGLDANARMAILTFVEKHTLEKKWGEFDAQSVNNTLRSKIQDIRAKHAKTA